MPYTRVNHSKFMVTDGQAFVTTSNWEGDYFISTAGVSWVTDHPLVRTCIHRCGLAHMHVEYRCTIGLLAYMLINMTRVA